jgi:hypothetical protein
MLQLYLQPLFTNVPNKMECWSLSNKYSMNEMKLAILLLRLHPNLTVQQSSWSFQDILCLIRHFSMKINDEEKSIGTLISKAELQMFLIR